MRRIMISLALFAACSAPASTSSPQVATPPVTPAASFSNPVIDDDFADPAAIRAADGWFYAYATQLSSGSRRVNIQGARSRDLVTWERLGDVLPAKPAWASDTQNFWAPHISQHGSTYYLYYAADPNTRTGMCIGVATGSTPAGPFTDVGKPIKCGKGFVVIDAFTLDDPRTGQTLLYWGSNSAPIVAQPLAANRTELAPNTQPVEILAPSKQAYEPLIEGPWLTLRDGFYYLFYSGDNCCGSKAHYAVLVARAKQPTGPFERKPGASAVILEGNDRWRAPGHNAVVRDDAGDDWMLYHAIDANQPTQPCANNADGTPAAKCGDSGELPSRRPMLIDRIVYRDGWPELPGAPSASPQRLPRIQPTR